MNISDYKFKVGDRVITTRGDVGRIINICTCEKCKERGFFEPTWFDYTNEGRSYISNYEAENNFQGYYSIGEYKFGNEFEKDDIIDSIIRYEQAIQRLESRLRTIEELMELEKGE